MPSGKHPCENAVAFITINEQNYLLDASDNYLSFDMLPFKALNGYGRVLDFENGSYWFTTTPKINTFERIGAALIMNEDGTLTGDLKKTYNGYLSKYKRELINEKSEENYLIYLENKTEKLEILSYTNEEFDNHEIPFKENFEIEIDLTETIGNSIYLNPFIEKYTKNPFQLEQRNYPVNFGFKINEIYIAQIDIPSDFIIRSIPKNIAFKLPNKGGMFIANFKNEDNKITVLTKIQLNYTIYDKENYQYLKEFFNQIIKAQNSLITLKKG